MKRVGNGARFRLRLEEGETEEEDSFAQNGLFESLVLSYPVLSRGVERLS